MDVIRSNKGGKKLCFAGYMYVVHKTSVNSIRWRCSKYSSLKCRAILVTTLDIADPGLRAEHNHPVNNDEIQATKCVETMKKKAKETLAKPLQIYAEAVATLENSTRVVMPCEDSAKRTLGNQRTPNVRNPRSLQELIIEGNWCTTGEPRNERFLLHDSGVDSEERIIIFSTDECLTHLANASAWFVDRNFSLAPQMQICVIRVKVQGVFVTCAYSLFERKTQVTYESMLRAIVSNCEERNLFPDPTYIHMDFEKAAMQAVKEVLGDHVVIRGCFYHLSQSTHRKLQELGLEQRYREDEQFSRFCGMMDGLAFLPIEHVARGMNYLKEIVPDGAQDLLDYFDSTYVSGTYRRVGYDNNGNMRLRNIPPVFPPETWNVHEATISDDERTNNQTEGFSNLVGQNHPSIWALIKKMRQELAADQTKLEQQNVGRLPQKKKRPAYVVMQDWLQVICEEYAEGRREIENFLNAISYNIRL